MRRNALAVLTSLAALAALAAGGAGARGASNDSDLAELARVPGVTVEGDRRLVVELLDPGVAETLHSTASSLDGWTVQLGGFDVASSDERRKADLSVGVVADGDARPALCPSEPSGPRSSDGSTTVYLGCDQGTGRSASQFTHSGDTSETIDSAMRTLLGHALGSWEGSMTVTEIAPGTFAIDLGKEVGGRLSELQFGDATELYTQIMFTLQSNGNIRQAELSIEGDCRAFALALGGDTCAPFVFTPRESR